MNKDRWHQIDEIFLAALDQPPENRSTFIKQACADDELLRKEVEELLNFDEQNGSMIDSPVFEVAAPILSQPLPILNNGQHFGYYDVLELIGTGGMGEVYLAEDVRLGRRVALKLLSADFTRNESMVAYFQREARAASSLNHPNIITIHEIGQEDGCRFIATEFIEGETLRQRIRREPLPLLEALDVTVQVISALGAAHRVGIIHKDIKPENIMLRPDGYVKVLDFGLAELSAHPSISKEAETPSLNEKSTIPNLIMGTVKYMSPEQAKGEEVDARSDIFSLGVVLYELITGCLPFQGESRQDVVAAIINTDPCSVDKYLDRPLPQLQEILIKALCKQKESRYQTAGEMLIDLSALKQKVERESEVLPVTMQDAENVSTYVPAQKASGIQTTLRKTKFRVAIALSLVALVLAVGWLIFKKKNSATHRSQQAPFERFKASRLAIPGYVSQAAISPDGRYIAYAATEPAGMSLWVMEKLTSIRSQVVAPTDVGYVGLGFSNDGSMIYYTTFGKKSPDGIGGLFQVPIAGGSPKLLLVGVVGKASWSPDGDQIAFLRLFESRSETDLMIASADGTGERIVASRKYPSIFTFSGGPVWSPDGQTLACAAGTFGDSFGVATFNLNNGTESFITSHKWQRVDHMAWSEDGNYLIVTATDPKESPQLWRVSYPGGEAMKLSKDVNTYDSLSATADFSSLVAIQSVLTQRIWVNSVEYPNQMKQIESSTVGYNKLCWTPDDKLVYSSQGIDGHMSIWMVDSDGANKKQLTTDGNDNWRPSITADGKYIVFDSERLGGGYVWRMDIDGQNQERLTTGGREGSGECSPDGKWVVYISYTGEGQTLWKFPLDGGAPVQLTDDYAEWPTVSPDGKRIAYTHLNEKEDLSIAVISFDGRGAKRLFRVEDSDAGQPVRWSRDGKAILFEDNRNGLWNIWSQPINGGSPVQITDFRSDRIWWFDQSWDGKRLACVRGTVVTDLVLIADDR